MKDQGGFGYPHCPVCDEILTGERIDILRIENIIKCVHCGTKITIANVQFQPKITTWELPN